MNAQDLEKNYTYRQLRKMYTVAAREARAGYRAVAAAYPGADVTQIYKGDFKSFTTVSKNGMKKADLAKILASTQRYLAGSASSVEKYEQRRQQTIETFQRHGYDVNEENIDSVQQFMKDATERGLKAIYGSDQLLTAYQRAKRRGLTKEQFAQNVERWTANAEAVEAGRKSGALRVISYKNSGSDSFEKW